MTYTELFGLSALGGGFAAIAGWLQLRRPTPVERRQKLLAFYFYLAMFAMGTVMFAGDVILPPHVSPSSWQGIVALLWCLVGLACAVSELRVAFRARNAGHQRSPADSNT
jgi:hypothetical protein